MRKAKGVGGKGGERGGRFTDRRGKGGRGRKMRWKRQNHGRRGVHTRTKNEI